MNLLNKIVFVLCVVSPVLLGQQKLMLDYSVKHPDTSVVTLNKNVESGISNSAPQIFTNQTELQKNNFVSSGLFKGLISGVIVSGAVAAYFKVKADNKFDLYNQLKEKKYMDETKKFDWFSGIGFAALQVNIGFLIYYFLIE